MRIGIFSDIHANVDALRVVIDGLAQGDIDQFVCLGDVVGYGASPDECCSLVRPLVRHCVLGNHDAAVAQRMDYEYYYSAARNALDYHRSLLTADNLAWLQELPRVVYEDDRCYSHGSPVNPEAFDYVFHEGHARDLLAHYEDLARITFIGHSHLTRSFRLNPDDEVDVEDVSAEEITLDETSRYIVTVGSVGQPRDHDARACYVVYDTDAGTVRFHRVGYDVRNAARRIYERDQLSPEFAKRLYLGI